MWKHLTGACLGWLVLGAAVLPAQRAISVAPCAQENATCRFSGNAWVMFGSETKYAARRLTNGTPCTNAVFGDPDTGVVKSCSVIPASLRFMPCAAENGTCSFHGIRMVIFGADPNYSGRLMSDTAACSNATFGDPAPNRPKTCMVLNAELKWNTGAPSPLSATYATLQMGTGGNLFLKFLPGGGLGTDIPDRKSYFAILASHSPPVSGDTIRLGDVTGQWVLTMQGNGTLAMEHNPLASGAALRLTATPTPGGLAVDLQASDNRKLVMNGDAFGLQNAVPPSSTMFIRFFTRAQVDQDMAKGQAQEQKLAPPQFGPGVN